MPPDFEVRILGPLEVRVDGRRVPLGGAKQRALLAILALDGNRVVSSEALIDQLWGERPPESARAALQVYVAHLRKLLPPDVLATRAPGYVLQLGPGQLDLERFETLAEDGRQALAAGDAAVAAARLGDALELWRGAPLAEFAYEAFATAEIARLEELRFGVLEDRVDADLARGRHAELVGELERLAQAHPLRERLHEQRMLALYRSGRQAEALDAYRAARRTLVETVGVEPGPALQQLERAILAQDPALEAAAAAAIDLPDPPTEARTYRTSGGRRTVTVVVSEIADSEALAERLDPEVVGRVLERYFETAATILTRHGGTVEPALGDAVMAVFGVPQLHEDDAVRAIRAAVELRDAVATLNDELKRHSGVEIRVRTGINTGEVVVRDRAAGRPAVTGDAVNVASRLEEACEPDEIVIGDLTFQLADGAFELERLEPLAIRGKTEPVRVSRVLGLAREIAPARRFRAPLVGRARERTLLEDAFERSVNGRACQLFTIIGPPGVGKSRLVSETLSDLADQATVVTGHCLPYGEGITFWPLAEALRQAAAINGGSPAEARDRLAALLDDSEDAASVVEPLAQVVGIADGAAGTEEIFWAARKLFESLAERRPLVCVFDDIHWAEPTFLDFVEHVADWARDAPILLVCPARPELLEQRPGWAGGKLNAISILLEPLPPTDAADLIEHLLGRTQLADEARERVTVAAEGNPLFIEEMLSVLLAQGLIRNEGERWVPTTDLGTVPVPTTIKALLAARIDQLPPFERTVLECAAVEGKEFRADALETLLPRDDRGGLQTALASLVRKELVRPARGRGNAFRFRHILVRDAAYESLTKQARADLHKQFALWLDADAQREQEHEEILAYHLECAYRYGSELGPADDDSRALGARAADRLESAGRRALGRGDAHAGANMLERALALLPLEAPARMDLLWELALALRELGRLADADARLAEAASAAAAAGDERRQLRALFERESLRVAISADARQEDVVAITERAIEIFERVGDDLGLAKAWRRRAEADWMACRWQARADSLERALVFARRAGDEREAAELLWEIGVSLHFGPMPAEDAAARCREFLAELGPDRRGEAGMLTAIVGSLESMRGRFDEARDHCARARAIFEEFGLRAKLGHLPFYSGFVETLAGDYPAAERELRAGYATLEQMGEVSELSTIAVLLADVVYLQGRYDEAAELTGVAEELGSTDDIITQMLWRSIRGKVAARRGSVQLAEQLAREAEAMSAGTDPLNYNADVLMNLAEVLELSGRVDEAQLAVQRAVEVYEAKGNIVSASRAASGRTASAAPT